MYVRSEVRPSIILWFCWKHVLFFLLYGTAIVYAFHIAKWRFLAIPFLPIGTIGTAVAFYIGFKNNASYERLWEGRKIWEAISNSSRALGALVMASAPASNDAKRTAERIVRRQIAWCNALRLNLRSSTALRNAHKVPPEASLIQSVFGAGYNSQTLPEYIRTALPPDEQTKLEGAFNVPLRLMEMQIEDIERLNDQTQRTSAIGEKMTDIAIDCIKQQGASERLKTFPFPRQYAHFSGVFAWIFMLLLPFGLVDELAKAQAEGLAWLVIPFNALISWMFITMEQVGDSSEDPFEHGLNDVPLTAICRDIEIELLQMLGEKDLPQKVQPVADILL